MVDVLSDGAMDFLFFITSFIIGVGLASPSSSSSSSLRTARLSAWSLSGPRQVVTDWDTSDTELRSDFLDRPGVLAGVLAGVLTSSVLGIAAMDLLVSFLPVPLTVADPLVPLTVPSDFLDDFLVDPASAGADLFKPEVTCEAGGAGAAPSDKYFLIRIMDQSKQGKGLEGAEEWEVITGLRSGLTFRIVRQLSRGLQHQTGSQLPHRVNVHTGLVGIFWL